jgi:N6-L-threonylcarbamoyladenine synthase
MTTLPSARILAIESSCDETACAILENGRALLSSTVASQMELHARYGGVFPEVASRQHVLSIMRSPSHAVPVWLGRWWWA